MTDLRKRVTEVTKKTLDDLAHDESIGEEGMLLCEQSPQFEAAIRSALLTIARESVEACVQAALDKRIEIGVCGVAHTEEIADSLRALKETLK